MASVGEEARRWGWGWVAVAASAHWPPRHAKPAASNQTGRAPSLRGSRDPAVRPPPGARPGAPCDRTEVGEARRNAYIRLGRHHLPWHRSRGAPAASAAGGSDAG
jgi:hypothetical protein